ncbi:right-handed parallel beta-helix repeat-containing protein [Streptomyces sp. SCSIO 30461]|uniref:right-handed parallel beta-helix repeat-containing protein n=1 Tax=Streptomyces sp. SCSIO 30461 TaxID=3118085 RepID=UPI0030CD981C
MSEAQDTGADASADESRRSVTAVLSRHWKLAVLAAAGFATVAATTTFAAVSHRETAAGARQATAPVDGKGLPAGGGDSGGKGGEGKGDHGKGGKGGHDKGGKGDGKKHGQKYGHHGDADATHVECDPNDLIANLVDLNAERGGELVLAKDCLYTLTANQDDNGLPEITQPITIHGNGATIQRAANGDDFRIFEVGVGGDLKLSHLTITRGKLSSQGSEGGGIRVAAAGRLDLDHVTLDRNSTNLENSDGGAIYNQGITTIRHSTLSKNTGEDGAAVYNEEGKLEITDSKITGNISDPNDGYAALFNDGGTIKVKKSLLSYNYGNAGGALYNASGVSEVEKSAVVHNFAYGGGGIYTDDSLYVRDSTIAYNTASSGGGGGLGLNNAAVIDNTKIYGNVATDSDGGGVYVFTSDDNPVVFRNSKIHDNQAPGNGQSGGGIYIDNGTVNLTDTKVTGNISDEEAGGVHNEGTVTTNGKVRIIDNVPTNCQATGTNPVPNCFG